MGEFLQYAFWVLVIGAAILALGTSRGLWLQGTKLDRFMDGIREEFEERVEGIQESLGAAEDNVRDEVAILGQELELLKSQVDASVKLRASESAPDTASLEHLDKKIGDLATVLTEEKAIRSRQVDSLGGALDKLHGDQISIHQELSERPTMATLNAVTAAKDQPAPAESA